MSFKTLGYNRKGEMMEIIIRDGSHSKIDTFKFSLKDKKMVDKINEILSNKYGVKFNPPKVYINDDEDKSLIESPKIKSTIFNEEDKDIKKDNKNNKDNKDDNEIDWLGFSKV